MYVELVACGARLITTAMPHTNKQNAASLYILTKCSHTIHLNIIPRRQRWTTFEEKFYEINIPNTKSVNEWHSWGSQQFYLSCDFLWHLVLRPPHNACTRLYCECVCNVEFRIKQKTIRKISKYCFLNWKQRSVWILCAIQFRLSLYLFHKFPTCVCDLHISVLYDYSLQLPHLLVDATCPYNEFFLQSYFQMIFKCIPSDWWCRVKSVFCTNEFVGCSCDETFELSTKNFSDLRK